MQNVTPTQWLDPQDLKPAGIQVRHDVGELALRTLVPSVRTHGILRPLIVVSDPSDARYKVLAGHRRWKAAMHLGLKRVPVVVKTPVTDIQALIISLADNLRDESLDVLEEGEYYHRLVAFGLQPERIAGQLAIDPGRVIEALTLALLGPTERQQLRSPLSQVILPLTEKAIEREFDQPAGTFTHDGTTPETEGTVFDAPLTERERECVYWAAAGKSVWEISQIFGVSKAVISANINAAVCKLNASTLVDAIARLMPPVFGQPGDTRARV